jgi:hypothetical protein
MRYSLAFVLLLVAVTESAQAGFSFRNQRFQDGDRDRIDLRVMNFDVGGEFQPLNGAPTGTKFSGLQLVFQLSGTSKAYFHVNIGGAPNGGDVLDPRNPTNVPNKSWVRIGSSANSYYEGLSPPATSLPAGTSPWIGGVNSFGLTMVGFNPVVAPAEPFGPPPLLFAQLYVDRDAGLAISGRLRGNLGPDVPIRFPYVIPQVPEPTSLAFVFAAFAMGCYRTRRRMT